jgi:alkylation response protein AidB-like acyl-CoA dehydrogenase
MDFGWSEAQQALHQRMIALGARVSQLPADGRMAELAAAGVLGLCLDRDHGGGGHDLLTTAYALEGLGRSLDDAGLLLAVGAHLFGVAMTLRQAGSDAQRQRWLAELATGARVATVAATEKGAGSDVAQVEATLEAIPHGWRASGSKAYVTHADRAGLYLFVARAAGQRGLSVALVPRESGGITVAAPLATLGLRGARLAPVSFACDLDEGCLLGRPGAGMAIFQLAMTYERALVLAFRLGAMQRQLDAAVAFARARKLGDVPIARHQAVSGRIARMRLRLEASRLLSYRAAWLLDHKKRAQAEAALAKWQLADAAVESALDAMRLRGALGYLEESGLGGELDDTLGGSIHSGTADVLAAIVARWSGL